MGDQPGQVAFPAIDPRQTFNFGAVRPTGNGQGELQDLVPIDELGLNRCSLIKVDVEGMEAKVHRRCERNGRAMQTGAFLGE